MKNIKTFEEFLIESSGITELNESKIKVTKEKWPYLEFKDGGKIHKVEFEYEDIIDDHGNEGQDQYWVGKDEKGQEWMIDVYADSRGEVEDIRYDTIVKESVNEMDEYSKDAHKIAKAAMKYFSKRDEVNGEEWDSFMYDATVMDRSINISNDEIDKYMIDDVINILFDNGYNRIDSDSIGGMYESVRIKTFEQFINESENKLNEELYDLVKDLKSVLGKGNSVKDVIEYLGRRLSKAEYAALQQAGVMKGKYRK